MSVYIFNKEKEKDLYRVTAPKKKKTLTVYEKFSAEQIHNDTHLDTQGSDVSTPLNMTVPMEEVKHDDLLQNTQQGFSKDSMVLEASPHMAFAVTHDSEPAFLPVKIAGGLSKRRVDRVKSRLVQKPL